jgi:hypothetical protein
MASAAEHGPEEAKLGEELPSGMGGNYEKGRVWRFKLGHSEKTGGDRYLWVQQNGGSHKRPMVGGATHANCFFLVVANEDPAFRFPTAVEDAGVATVSLSVRGKEGRSDKNTFSSARVLEEFLFEGLPNGRFRVKRVTPSEKAGKD